MDQPASLKLTPLNWANIASGTIRSNYNQNLEAIAIYFGNVENCLPPKYTLSDGKLLIAQYAYTNSVGSRGLDYHKLRTPTFLENIASVSIFMLNIPCPLS